MSSVVSVKDTGLARMGLVQLPPRSGGAGGREPVESFLGGTFHTGSEESDSPAPASCLPQETVGVRTLAALGTC